MAENKLEGFEDLDNALGEGEGGGAADKFAGELDDLLGAEAGTEAGTKGAAAQPAQADSELDSFFEDLSTIDDLEVLQEGEAPAPAAEEAPAPEPEAAPAPAARAAPEPPRPRAPRPPRVKKEPGFLRRWFVRLIVLGILFGGGYYAYEFFFPNAQLPWQVVQQQKTRLMGVFQKPAPKLPPAPTVEEPPPPPPPVVQPRPVVRKPAPPREHGPWSIQIATCFFPSCLDSYKTYLLGQKRSVVVRERMSSSESLEIYSISTWREREPAQELVDRINGAHPLEGHAFLLHESGGDRISMGAFADLARANIVKDALNQQYQGQVAFATRVRAFPYKLQTVMTGRFPTREAAEQALAALRNAEPRLKDAFVARNQ
jgi:hypothetical protein